MQTTVSNMDPDMCQIFSFFITLSILHVETCVIPLWKAVFCGFISFFLHLRALSHLCGRYDSKTEKIADFVLVTVSFLHIGSSVKPLLKALEIFLCFPYTEILSTKQFMRTIW